VVSDTRYFQSLIWNEDDAILVTLANSFQWRHSNVWCGEKVW